MNFKLLIAICTTLLIINPIMALDEVETESLDIQEPLEMLQEPEKESIKSKIPSFILPKSFLKEKPILSENEDYDEFVRLYEKDYSEIFISILTSLSESDFNIKEINSNNGYIIFSLYSGKKFVIYIKNIEPKKNYIKIMPYNSKYDFPSEIIKLLFDKIDLSLKDTIIEKKVH